MRLFSNLFGAPNVERMKARRDLDGLLKAMQHQGNDAIRLDAMQAAVDVAAMQLDVLDDAKPRIERVVTALFNLAKNGDPNALGLLVTIVSRQRKVDSVNHNKGMLRSAGQTALATIGEPVVAPLLDLLLHPGIFDSVGEWKGEGRCAQLDLIKVLDDIGSVKAIKPLLSLAIASEDSDFRQAYSVAFMNYYVKYGDELKAMVADCSEDERKFVEAMIGYVQASRRLRST